MGSETPSLTFRLCFMGSEAPSLSKLNISQIHNAVNYIALLAARVAALSSSINDFGADTN